MGEYVRIITADIDRPISRSDIQTNLNATMREVCKTLSENDFDIGSPRFVTLNESDASTGLDISYSAKESLFFTILCNSVLAEDDGINSPPNENFPLNEILKQYNIWELWLSCIVEPWTTIPTKNDCDIRTRRDNSNDYPFIFYNLISSVLNDITNMIIARIYWYISLNEEFDTLANAYIINHFWTPWTLPEMDNYPQTMRQLEKYIEAGQKMFQTLYLIKDTQERSDLHATPTRQNFLHYDAKDFNTPQQLVDILPSYHSLWIDLLYNELFFYHIFSDIYINYIENFRAGWPLPLALSSNETKLKDAIALQEQRVAYQKSHITTALDNTLRQINNLISAFPLHVGMLMYQEDILAMRNNLALIYLPLHQLHFKLENVQTQKQ